MWRYALVGKVRLVVVHYNEDDPRKCTARKMQRFDLAHLVASVRHVPHDAVLLSPFSKKSLSREDAAAVHRHGLVAVDCSWKTAENVFEVLEAKNPSRALPFLIAVNPVNYGKPFQLTTLEAFAAALYIVGDVGQAQELVRLYKWAPHFLELNKEPLEAYRQAQTSAEVVAAMYEFLPK